MYKVVKTNTTPIGISNVLNTLKSNYSSLNVMSFYSKDPIGINDAIKYYGSPQYPGQSVPTFYQNKFEADKDDDQNSTTTTGNNEVEEEVTIEQSKFKVILQSIPNQNEDSNSNTQQQQQQQQKQQQFNINKYFTELKTLLFGKQMMHSKLMTSTQTMCLKYLSNTRQGLVVLADQQTQGKGRGGNSWVSPIGCLLYSFKCKQSDGNKLPFLQYVAGLAMIEAIHSFPIASDLNVCLKWPNDIYGDDCSKIGGILCQSNYLNNEFDVIIGIGINVSNHKPSISINRMIHNKLLKNKQQGNQENKKENENEQEEEEEIPIYISRESLLSKFFNKFEEIYITFTKEGFKPLENRYTNCWLHTNSIVQLKENNNQFVKIIGLTDNGFLKAIDCDSIGNPTSSNQIHELHPDGTSFDIKNLILKKKE